MKFLLFGTGDYYERYKKWFTHEEVIALLDNSRNKQKMIIDGIKVLSPEQGIKLSYDAIIILSFYVKAMREQLMKLGVSEEKIFHFYDLHRLIDVNRCHRPVHYFDVTDKMNILLLSQDLTLGGPALALFHMAEVLKSNGYDVTVGSMLDGPLRETISDNSIPVIVDENMQIGTMKNCNWVKQFSMILCSTINFYVFLSERFVDIPTIWWLHDSLFFYDGVDKQLLQRIDRTNLTVLSVGPVPKKAMQKFLPDLEINRLLYGVADTQRSIGRKEHSNERLCFVTIGYIERRKGQDLLVQAIQRIPKEIRKQAIFYFVGQNISAMAQQLQEEIKNIPEIVVTGTKNRNEINEILSQADLLICPSREDPMPTVAAEAMMHEVACMVSDVTGTAAYLKDGEDGVVFQSENVQELSDKIVMCIERSEKLREMGIRARSVYEKYFSMTAFERDLLDTINNILH